MVAGRSPARVKLSLVYKQLSMTNHPVDSPTAVRKTRTKQTEQMRRENN